MIDLLAIRTGTAGRTGTGEHSKAITRWCGKIFSESGLYSWPNLWEIVDKEKNNDDTLMEILLFSDYVHEIR